LFRRGSDDFPALCRGWGHEIKDETEGEPQRHSVDAVRLFSFFFKVVLFRVLQSPQIVVVAS
jgi:hypothetical protein